MPDGTPTAPSDGFAAFADEMDEWLQRAAEPAVPDEPRLRAPLTRDETVTVIHPPEPFAVSILLAEPPVEQPDPPDAAAHVGFAAPP